MQISGEEDHGAAGRLLAGSPPPPLGGFGSRDDLGRRVRGWDRGRGSSSGGLENGAGVAVELLDDRWHAGVGWPGDHHC